MQIQKHRHNRLPFTILALLIMLGMASCVSSKKLKYFQDLPDTDVVDLPPAPMEERVIEFGDQIEINFSAKDQSATAFFGRGVPAPAAPAQATEAPPASQGVSTGYVVDPLGFIEMPVLGKLKVKGLTARQLKTQLTEAVKVYLKEPIVEVNFLTFRVTVLGEVRSPGTVILPMQRTTIFEALGATGDLPHQAQRYGIQLYRDYNGKRSITKIDLRKKDVLYNKDVFQMKHNDVIIVQPRAQSVLVEEIGVFTAILSIVLSVATLGFTIYRRNN